MGANTIYRRNYFTVFIWFVASRKKNFMFFCQPLETFRYIFSVSQFLVYLRQETLLVDSYLALNRTHTLIKSKFIPRGFEHWRYGADGENNGDSDATSLEC